MKPSELLHEVRRRLLSGPAKKTWGKGSSSYTRLGPRCILGWIATVEHEQGLEATLACEWQAMRVLKRALPPSVAYAPLSIITFNDAPKTTLWDVVAVLGKAQRELEAGGE